MSVLDHESLLVAVRRNRPLIVTDASLSSGAGFVVAYCGDIMTMPGLPRTPSAEHIDISDSGEITGLS